MGCYVMSYYDVINPYLIKKDSSEFYKRNKKEVPNYKNEVKTNNYKLIFSFLLITF